MVTPFKCLGLKKDKKSKDCSMVNRSQTRVTSRIDEYMKGVFLHVISIDRVRYNYVYNIECEQDQERLEFAERTVKDLIKEVKSNSTLQRSNDGRVARVPLWRYHQGVLTLEVNGSAHTVQVVDKRAVLQDMKCILNDVSTVLSNVT